MTEPAFGSVELPADGSLTSENLADMLNGMASRQQSALALHRALSSAPGSACSASLLTYRCRKHRCLLLDVFNTPVGLAIYWPPFKLSPEHNERTADSARIERTSDGQRRWVERADLLRSIDARGMFLEMNCDHVSRHPRTADEIREDVRRHAKGEVLI